MEQLNAHNLTIQARILMLQDQKDYWETSSEDEEAGENIVRIQNRIDALAEDLINDKCMKN
jgi:hypothetical protein